MPAWTLSPASRCESAAMAAIGPLSASASTNGSVALLRANVEVRATAPGIIAGVLTGVALNLCLWVFAGDLFWMWWNVTGLAAAVAVTLLVSRVTRPVHSSVIARCSIVGSGFLQRQRLWRPAYTLLLLYFGLMLATLFWLDSVAVRLSI